MALRPDRAAASTSMGARITPTTRTSEGVPAACSIDPGLEVAELGRGEGRDRDRVPHRHIERVRHLFVDDRLVGASRVGRASVHHDRIAHDAGDRRVEGELPGDQAGILRAGRGHLGDDGRHPHRLLHAGEGVDLGAEPGDRRPSGPGNWKSSVSTVATASAGRVVALQRLPAGVGSTDARQRRHHDAHRRCPPARSGRGLRRRCARRRDRAMRRATRTPSSLRTRDRSHQGGSDPTAGVLARGLRRLETPVTPTAV